MIPKHIADWAKRFVCGNTSEMVEKQTKALTESESNTMLIEAVQQVQNGLKPGRLGGRKFGHDEIANDKLPLVNEQGFFLRNDNNWKYFSADQESVVQLCLETSTVVIDHVDNLFYSERKPFLFPNRSILRITSGFYEGKSIWSAQKNANEGWRVTAGNESYVDYWDNVGGTESKIRMDFMLNKSDISEMTKTFLNDEPFPSRFDTVPNFFGFHPEITREYLGEDG